ncbi:MAG TPA: helix-turn-helix domain-containing protein [Pirellulaceae bacterium]
MDTHAILISLDDAAWLLSITPFRLRRLVREGRVPVVDLGDGELRFSRRDLQQWVEQLPRRELAHA